MDEKAGVEMAGAVASFATNPVVIIFQYVQ
jgi:hypothetical protein